MSEYRDKLFNPTRKHVIKMQSLRLNKDKKMSRFSVVKTGLSDLFYKNKVADDAITCSPLTFNGTYL